MAVNRLHELLDAEGVAYEVTTHPYAVTADEVAASEGVSGHEVAKPVLVSVSGELAMIVIAGSERLDLQRASEVLGNNEVRLATEDEFAAVFDDSEVGGEPPFGNLYGIPTFLDEDLRARPRMVCRDGSHTQTVTIAVADYVRLVQPEIVDVAMASA